MWLLWIFSLMNAVTPRTWMLENRLPYGLQLLDPVWIVCSILAMFLGRRNPNDSGPVHPLYRWTMLLLIIGWIGGMLSSVVQGFASDHLLFTKVLMHAREYATFPAAIFIGYRMTRDMRSVRAALWLILLCGSIVAALQLAHF